MTANGNDLTEWTFAMVDLAGFTALTEAHGDAKAAELAINFSELAVDRLAPGDRLVKSIGDAVLLASCSPESGIALVAGLLEDCAKLPGFPIARAGLHRGPAAERNGDFFGAAVNLTARVTAQATGGQTLATQRVADAAAQSGLSVRSVGEFELRNVAEACELFELELHQRAPHTVIDPVCRMRVDLSDAAAMVRDEGTELWFCSARCAETFLAAPDRHRPST